MEELFLDAKDGYKLSLNIFEVENCKAIVQIAHGMEEHKERYNDFAKFLNEKGFYISYCRYEGTWLNLQRI